MIENSYSLNLSTKEAQKNVDELNKSFELQADLVGKLEKELQEYESELKSLTGAGGKTLKQRSELNKKISQARKAFFFLFMGGFVICCPICERLIAI